MTGDDEDRFRVANPCERCRAPMHEDRIGVCPECHEAEARECHEAEARDPMEDFYAWGGWRRAFAEGDPEAVGDVCGP